MGAPTKDADLKFTNGYWLMREGVAAHYAAEAYEVEAADGSLKILAPTRPIRHRGDTLQGPVLNIGLSSPAEGVIKVRMSHFEGTVDRGPHFPLLPQELPEVATSIGDDTATLNSGRLQARVSRRDPFRIEILADGEPLTSIPDRGLGYMQVRNEGAFVHGQLSLSVGDLVYGLGERFSNFVKNGQTVEIWNEDGGTGSEQAYKSVPFYLTNRGYGVFVNHPGKVSFEVASEKLSRVQFSVPGEAIEFFIIHGPSPKEILEKYTALTGRPALPPPWSFGLWLSTSFTTDYDEATVTEFIQGMADRDLPLHVFHFDCFWMRGFRWCDFQWDPKVFPDPAAMLGRLKERGLRICVWINPYIAQQSELFAEARDGGYLLKRPSGDAWQWDMWQPGMGIVDFTNPKARDWFQSKLGSLMDQGVDAFKTDFGERIPTDVVVHDGSEPERAHNFYPYVYNKTVFELLESRRGKGEAVVFARSATAGCQQFPVHWGGDCYSNFESMAETLRGGLSLGLSGFGFWSHDIGGFEGSPPPEVYKRWIAFGLLSSHSRLHGSTSYRVPWLVDEESCDVLRLFTKLKCRLMPYLWSKALEAHRSGIPMLRAMLLEFPEDLGCEALDRQYMLGDALMVSPVFTPEGKVDVYYPHGVWTHLLNGERIEGGGWRSETHGFLSLPLAVRPHTLLPLGSVDESPDYEYADGVEIGVFELGEGRDAAVSIYQKNGESSLAVKATRAGTEYRFEAEGRTDNWSVLLPGVKQAADIEGGSGEATEGGLRVRFEGAGGLVKL